MRVIAIRAYLREAVEFLLYFVFMTLLGAAMYVLVTFRPQANSRWYIETCVAVAVCTGIYALRMFLRYRRAMRRFGPLLAEEDSVETQARPKRRRTRAWAERIADDRVETEEEEELEPRLLGLAEYFGIDPEAAAEARAALEGEAGGREGEDMSIEAIRARIAERMAREAEAEEEARKLFHDPKPSN